MPAGNDALAQVQAFRTRVTKLNANGVPSNGPNKSYVSNALVVLNTAPVYTDGVDIQDRNGEGLVCVSFQGPDTFRRVDFDMTICTPDANLLEMVTGGRVITNGGATGFSYPPMGTSDPTNISIEFWTKRVNDGSLDDTYPYAWWVLGRCKNMRLGKKTFGNQSVQAMITGKAYDNPNWYDGPTNNWRAASDRVLQWMPCLAADLPAVSTNYVTVAAS